MDLTSVRWRKSSYMGRTGDNRGEVTTVWRKSSYSGSAGGNCVEVATVWRKSSYSASNGGACVEVATAWEKSSYSGTTGGNCVEVSRSVPEAVAVRDSKDPDGPRLVFTPQDWRVFTSGVRSGDFHLG